MRGQPTAEIFQPLTNKAFSIDLTRLSYARPLFDLENGILLLWRFVSLLSIPPKDSLSLLTVLVVGIMKRSIEYEQF